MSWSNVAPASKHYERYRVSLEICPSPVRRGICLHETSTTRNHDILDIRQWLEFRASSKNWRTFPDTKVLEEVTTIAIVSWSFTDTSKSANEQPLFQRFGTLTGVPGVGGSHDEEFELGEYVTKNSVVEVLPINNCDASRNLQSRCGEFFNLSNMQNGC
jgi:hypothetical protein